MKKALAHLPELKWDELEQLAPCVQKLHKVTERICKESTTEKKACYRRVRGEAGKLDYGQQTLVSIIRKILKGYMPAHSITHNIHQLSIKGTLTEAKRP